MSVQPEPAPANAGYKQGLPLAGLAMAETSAMELWKIARLGMATNEAYAVQLGGTKASGGAWRTRIALLRGFKLIKTEGDRIGLSHLGQALVNASDPAGQVTARRTALLSLRSYADLVSSFEGTELPETTVLATRLQFEYGKAPEAAAKAAKAFVESLRHAEMIDHENIVRRHGNPDVASPEVDLGDEGGVITGAPLVTDGTDQTQADEEEAATELDEAFEADASIAESQPAQPAAPPSSAASPSITNAVAISVTLDLSNFRADEVVQILTALKGM